MGFNLFKPIQNIAKGVGRIFSGGRDASQQAIPYLNQIPQYGREAYNPFIQQGAQAGEMLNPIYQRMAQDPNAYINEIMGQYQQSPGFDLQRREMLKEALGAATAGGYAGSQEDQRSRAAMIQELLGGDMQSYLQNRLNLQGVGLQGLENKVGRGFQGAGSMADYLGTADLNKANLKFQGIQQKDINQNAMFQSILKAAAAAFGASQGMPGMGGGDNVTPGKPQGSSTSQFKPLRSIEHRPVSGAGPYMGASPYRRQ